MQQFYNLKTIIKSFKPRRKTGQLSNQESQTYIGAAAKWLAVAQDATSDKGVSASYSIVRAGWKPSYLETTGYIIETMLTYADYAGDNRMRERARQAADWLISCQMPEGAFQGGNIKSNPVPRIFNTGQIMIGLLCIYRQCGEEKYLLALQKAADWLLSVQATDGSWLKNNLEDQVPTYNTRVAWPLLALGLLTKRSTYIKAGTAYLDWAKEQQRDNGWFDGNIISLYQGQLTHFLAYAASGMLEGGLLLNSVDYINSAKRFADAMLDIYLDQGRLPGTFAPDWSPKLRATCLTGNAQISIIWLQLYSYFHNEDYLRAASKMNAELAATIDLDSNNPAFYGALAGSDPIWGAYMRLSFPNWATKFFLDALLLERKYVYSVSR